MPTDMQHAALSFEQHHDKKTKRIHVASKKGSSYKQRNRFSLHRRSLKVMLISKADPVKVARISLVAVEGHLTACMFFLAQHLLPKPPQMSETAASSMGLEVTGSRTRYERRQQLPPRPPHSQRAQQPRAQVSGRRR